MRQGHVPVCVAIKKRECLEDEGNGAMKPRGGALQHVPLLAGLRCRPSRSLGSGDGGNGRGAPDGGGGLKSGSRGSR